MIVSILPICTTLVLKQSFVPLSHPRPQYHLAAPSVAPSNRPTIIGIPIVPTPEIPLLPIGFPSVHYFPWFGTSNTNNGQKNTVNVILNICGDQTIVLDLCNPQGTDCADPNSGDTVLRLHDSEGRLVAYNDNYCGLCSRITYEVPGTAYICQPYSLHQVPIFRRTYPPPNLPYNQLMIHSNNFIQSINQSTNQSTNQSINQSTNQPINQSTNHLTNQLINQSINQPFNQSINQPINQPTNQSINQSIHNQSINQPTI